MSRGHVSRFVVVACAVACAAGGCTGGLQEATIARNAQRMVRQATGHPPAPPTRGEGPTQVYALPAWEPVRVKQATAVWCWAACAEMVRRYGGQQVTQEQIAERILGRTDGGRRADLERTAEEVECLAALDPDAYERARRNDEARARRQADLEAQNPKALVRCEPSTRSSRRLPSLDYDPDQLVADLRERRPVVVGLGVRSEADSEHVVVIHAADVQRAVPAAGGGSGGPKHHIVAATYTDPDTGADAQIPGATLQHRADFMASRERVGEYFQYLAEEEYAFSVVPPSKDKDDDKAGSDDRGRRGRPRPSNTVAMSAADRSSLDRGLQAARAAAAARNNGGSGPPEVARSRTASGGGTGPRQPGVRSAVPAAMASHAPRPGANEAAGRYAGARQAAGGLPRVLPPTSQPHGASGTPKPSAPKQPSPKQGPPAAASPAPKPSSDPKPAAPRPPPKERRSVKGSATPKPPSKGSQVKKESNSENKKDDKPGKRK